MTPVSQKKVETIVKCLYADGCDRVSDWHGCEVYILRYDKPICIGGPSFLFVYGDDVHAANRDECLAYMQYIRSLPKDEASHNNAG
ncbi:MAG: hypothetical protein LUD50_01785 [Clostridia bacterium]|nr:hypothetical protein [Clostridia bacterium]